MVAKFVSGLLLKYTVAKAQLMTENEIPTLTESYNRLSHLQISLAQPINESQPSAMAAIGGLVQS